jgi:hypothetical protein
MMSPHRDWPRVPPVRGVFRCPGGQLSTGSGFCRARAIHPSLPINSTGLPCGTRPSASHIRRRCSSARSRVGDITQNRSTFHGSMVEVSPTRRLYAPKTGHPRAVATVRNNDG